MAPISASVDGNTIRMKENKLAAVRIIEAYVDIFKNELKLEKKVAGRTTICTKVTRLLPFSPCFTGKPLEQK